MSRATLLCVPVLLLAACRSASPEPQIADPIPPEPISLEGWRPERIQLPPAFAPSLPTGEELLLFAPGMFDAESPEYWSYVFVARIDEPGFDEARLLAFFEPYYDGLITTVAGGAAGAGERGADVPADPAQVSLTRVADGSYEATIDLIDAFVTMEPVTLHLRIDTADRDDGGWMWVQASPQPRSHEIWRALHAAAESLEL